RRPVRCVTAIGGLLWIAGFLSMTSFEPLLHGHLPRFLAPRFARLYWELGLMLPTAIAAFQVTVLSMAAARHCRRYVAELGKMSWDHDLLKSRSETELDDFFV